LLGGVLTNKMARALLECEKRYLFVSSFYPSIAGWLRRIGRALTRSFGVPRALPVAAYLQGSAD
jgi:hypothetical protein